ncbi:MULTISPECIES: SGNH/GDSL hydrolase family protein [unclassified Arthrobacter]|uniref:SGNH/GDSL hydrolase family protein n=1 Tax=unclassified Arthrobacter TaxID=235627 RepID=UPI001D150F9F|nr:MULTISPECIES: SGNH/GDSL hydrolase family protein [unclassified Arthrobacter]MCC3290116.1 SGNH/GDSL hydrolase family protein [Arthrobacter sp. zg-Y1110]MCC3300372.1 SGNH/GDSL hydrolase family protein [Arthrobacter sp. zg-Y895]UWX84491.1 SGNH/GDSL hydrolase family protein [Arthrobacter sp. zg-Y1110]
MSPKPLLSRRLAVLAVTTTALLAGGAAPASAGGAHGPDSRGGHTVEHRGGHGYGGGHGHGGGHGGGHGYGGGHGHGGGHGGGHGRGHGSVDYVAFGDSYASGFGGGPVLDTCGRTAQGYPVLLDALDRVELDGNVTCSGATALTTPPDAPVDLPEQIDDAAARGLLNRKTDTVTVTIGGDDVRFASVVAACAGAQLPATCAPAIDQAAAYAQTVLAPQLAAEFARIAELAPRATLVVTGYPYLFEPGTPGPLSTEAQALFTRGTDALNTVIAEQVPDNGVFVDVVDEFAGHGVGSTDSWIIFDLLSPYNLHPTETGYREGYTAAILEDAGSEFGVGCRGRR